MLTNLWVNPQSCQLEVVLWSPQSFFRSAAALLSFGWSGDADELLASATHSRHREGNPYSTLRERNRQFRRTLRFLSKQEVLLCRQALSDSGLDQSTLGLTFCKYSRD